MKQLVDRKKTYFISGGGTGGHIYPAIAVARELLNQSDTDKIYYIGNKDNLEHEIISKIPEIEFLSVGVSGMPRKPGIKFLKWFVELEIATWKALLYVIKYKPDAIFTTGGYVSAPVAFASILLNKPFMIHDCDVEPGLVSKLVASSAKIVSVAFSKSKEFLKSGNAVCNGNPVREEFFSVSKAEAQKSLGLKNKLTIFAMGGSQGAKTINKSVLGVAQELVEQLDIQLVLQTGMKNYMDVIEQFEAYFPHFRENTNLIIRPYFDEMALPLKAADIVIARAGSLSLSEMNICALPSILIPYPYAAADHQRKNAKEMQQNGASLYLEDSECNKNSLMNYLKELIVDSEKRKQMSISAQKLAKPDATSCIVTQLKSLIK